MRALNTDILLEYLVDGHEKSEHADLFFDSASESETYFLNNIVLFEVITSFEQNVKFDKSEILTALRAMVSNSQIRFENRDVITKTIERYSASRINFSECLKAAINRNFQTDESIPALKKGKISTVV